MSSTACLSLILIALCFQSANAARPAKGCKKRIATPAAPAVLPKDLRDKAFFDELVAAFKHPSSTAVPLTEFTARHQVWLGECVGKMEIASEPHYYRDEYYLPVVRHKTPPGAPLKIQFAAIDVSGNPYSGRIIAKPEDAIWYLGGEAGSQLSRAAVSKKRKALVAEFGKTTLLALKRGKLNGEDVYLYARYKEGTEITLVGYFDEQLL